MQAIRALGGHSAETEARLDPDAAYVAVRPDVLYLRIPRRNVVAALTKGLALGRWYVLSETATPSRPDDVVLRLDMAAALAAGVHFYGGGHLIYTRGLDGRLPSEWLKPANQVHQLVMRLLGGVLARPLRAYLIQDL